MSRRMWLALAITALVAASFAASVVAAKRATEDRPRYVTRGLDYLHYRQADNGGFDTPSNTAWGILGAVASGERMGSSAWKVGGKNPFDYLESINHEAAASGAGVDNAPVYYARAVMAYVAVDRRERVFIAGTPRVDLLAKLYSYQNWSETEPDPLPDTWGSFSPSTSMRQFDAVHTTSWAVLAMRAFGLDDEPRYAAATEWLAGQQKASGGFPSEAGKNADLLNTSLAVQALVAAPAGTVPAAALEAARQYLKDNQNDNGGFPVNPGERTDAEATAAAIQAIVALGEGPEDDYWKEGINTPVYALGTLQRTNGSYKLTSASNARPLAVTSWALVAMRRKSFTAFPKSIGEAEVAFTFRPRFRTISPKNGAKFTSTRIVLIRATYTDFSPKGTGIKTSASRVYVDNVNKSRAANIGKYGLRLQLKDVPNGSHTYRIELVDNAGNRKVLQRKFTVNVPTPTPQPTSTYRPVPAPVYPPVYPTPTRTTYPDPAETSVPEPYETVTPYPYASPSPYPSESGQPVIGSPVPSPSSSAGAGGSAGGGSAGGFVGGTLLAMLPIGAAASYLVLRRREDVLGEASQGAVFGGGGSAWERMNATLAKSKDLTKPTSRK